MLARFRLGAAAASITVIAILAACGSPPRVEPSPEVTDALRTLVEPPSEPPLVSIQGEELPPLYYDWVIDGEPVIFKQSENQDDIRLTQVPHPSKTLEVVIGSGVPPADLVIATFEHVDANGVPTDSGGMQTDCLREVDRCDLIYGPDSLTVTLEAAESAQVVVLQLLYAARNPDGDGMIHMNASWGVRLDVDR